MIEFPSVVAGVSLLIACVVIWQTWSIHRGVTLLMTSAAILGPLVMLSLYLVYEYSSWQWALFPYGSLAPYAFAALIFVVAMGFVLIHSGAPVWAKIVVGTCASIGWLALGFLTSLLTACAMGDCL